jgi:signal transduction histidine kinase
MRPRITVKNENAELAESYLRAMRAHLQTSTSGVAAAGGVGAAIKAAGLDRLDLVELHERAMEMLGQEFDFTTTANGFHRRRGEFFTAAMEPLNQGHSAARKSFGEARHPIESLRLHRLELAKSHRKLAREIARRERAEARIKAGKERFRLLQLQSRTLQGKLRGVSHQILFAQEQERREISRVLHDEVVQTLVGINVELAALGKASSVGRLALKTKLVSTQRLVEKSVSTVHQFGRDLRPAELDDLGLVPALQAYMKIVAARKKLRIRLTAFAGVEKLHGDKRTVLYRVAQEALTNVGRHAEASLVKVTITQIAGMVRMEVRDDGKSFRVASLLSSKTNKRLGLLDMRERVEMVGGTLVIESAPGEGTTVRVEIPFSPVRTL